MGGRYIIPLDLGDSVGDRSLSYLRRGVGEKEQGKRGAAYIGGAKKKIVVDTGPPDLERSLKYHPYSKSDPRKPEQEMEAQLAKCGVKPEDIIDCRIQAGAKEIRVQVAVGEDWKVHDRVLVRVNPESCLCLKK